MPCQNVKKSPRDAPLMRRSVPIMPLVPAIFYRVMKIVGHFVARVGHEILSFFLFAFAAQIDGDAGGKGSSKGC